MLVEKVKRPAGVFSFEFADVDEDSYGSWLFAPTGSKWVAPHDHGSLPVDVLMLLNPELWYASWWVDDPADRRVEIDVCPPPERTARGWSYVDLELDVVRHEPDRVTLDDSDEFEAACRSRWITPADAEIAARTAAEMKTVLESRVAPWSDEGWRRLAHAKMWLNRRETRP